MRLFVGYDPREAIGHFVFLQSLYEHAGQHRFYEIVPLLENRQGDGTNRFTYSRFSIPELMDWSGSAIFLDSADMLLRADIGELWDLRDSNYAVQVVKHDYQTKHPLKYVGTPLEASNRSYPRKNWSSVTIWNAGHKAHFDARDKRLSEDGAFLHRFGWLPDELIGELPIEWNHLVGEMPHNPEAKLAHFTLGIPGFSHYGECDYADEWKQAQQRVNEGMQYAVSQR